MSSKVIAILLAVVAAILLLPRLGMSGLSPLATNANPPAPARKTDAEKTREWIGIITGGVAAIGDAFGRLRAPPPTNETMTLSV